MSASPGIKELRILSGTHAGASLDLSDGTHSVDARHDCDISITDWRFSPLSLHVGRDGVAVAQWSTGSPHALRFEDFVPIDFAGTVVCIGPCNATWPDRAQLLAGMQSATAPVAPTAPPVEAGRKLDRRVVSWGGATLIALVTMGWFASATSKPTERPVPTTASVHASLQQALDAAVGSRLHVSEVGRELVVDGLLDDQRQAHAASAAIDAVPQPLHVARRFCVASDVAETIRTAVGLPGAHIDYRGGGVFAFTAETTDVAATQAAIDRVAVDLAPTVRRINAMLEEPPEPHPPMPAVLSALATDDGIDVMETRDGVKHLVMTPQAAAASAAQPHL